MDGGLCVLPIITDTHLFVFQGEFKWTDGSPFSYYLWEFGEPDNINGEEDCVESNYSRKSKKKVVKKVLVLKMGGGQKLTIEYEKNL